MTGEGYFFSYPEKTSHPSEEVWVLVYEFNRYRQVARLPITMWKDAGLDVGAKVSYIKRCMRRKVESFLGSRS